MAATMAAPAERRAAVDLILTDATDEAQGLIRRGLHVAARGVLNDAIRVSDRLLAVADVR